MIRTTWDDQVDVLHDGRADVSIVRLPIDQAGLSVRPLFEEPRVAMLPSDHRLAGKPIDRDHRPRRRAPASGPRRRTGMARHRTRTPRRARPSRVPTFRSVEEKLEHVAAGRGISIIPLSVATFYHRPDVAAVPVDDLAPNKVCLAWIATRRSRLLHDFADIAAATVEWAPSGPSQWHHRRMRWSATALLVIALVGCSGGGESRQPRRPRLPRRRPSRSRDRGARPGEGQGIAGRARPGRRVPGQPVRLARVLPPRSSPIAGRGRARPGRTSAVRRCGRRRVWRSRASRRRSSRPR